MNAKLREIMENRDLDGLMYFSEKRSPLKKFKINGGDGSFNQPQKKFTRTSFKREIQDLNG